MPQHADIGNQAEAVRVRCLWDVRGFLRPTGDEAREGAPNLRHQYRAGGIRPLSHPVEIAIGNLLAWQARLVQSTLVLLQFDDGAPEFQSVNRRGETDCQRAGHHLSIYKCHVRRVRRGALAVARPRPYEGSHTDTSGGNA